ncbi:hypothetical protein V5799_003325, partial [Amblyomma americanum]
MYTFSLAVNRRDAGYSELDVTVTSPLGRHLPIEVKGTADGDGELIEFTPTVPGKYRIAITYGGIEVPGKLKVEVRGAEDVIETHMEQTSGHRYRVTFTPEEE